MWKIESAGVGRWYVAPEIAWTIRAAGGDHGIEIARDGGTGSWAGFQPVGEDRLPVASEQFVRKRQWHVIYPQAEQSYALSIVFTPIEATHRRLILEATLSIQTSLLDTHPMIDLCVPGGGRIGTLPAASRQPDEQAQPEIGSSRSGAEPIHLARAGQGSVAVLLSPHDYPFTQDRSAGGELRLRLFGDFLEKGVIRKARPWLWIERSGGPPEDREVLERWCQLRDSPLPLMA